MTTAEAGHKVQSGRVRPLRGRCAFLRPHSQLVAREARQTIEISHGAHSIYIVILAKREALPSFKTFLVGFLLADPFLQNSRLAKRKRQYQCLISILGS